MTIYCQAVIGKADRQTLLRILLFASPFLYDLTIIPIRLSGANKIIQMHQKQIDSVAF
jgi:hypothetical protein